VPALLLLGNASQRLVCGIPAGAVPRPQQQYFWQMRIQPLAARLLDNFALSA
jgi:hypothetical protein